MPLYDFHCTKCDHVFSKILSMSDRDIPLTEPCPSCGESGAINKVFGVPPIADPVRLGRIKPPDGFRDVLRHIKKSYHGSQFTVD
mgnify:CR=1 FL=1